MSLSRAQAACWIPNQYNSLLSAWPCRRVRACLSAETTTETTVETSKPTFFSADNLRLGLVLHNQRAGLGEVYGARSKQLYLLDRSLLHIELAKLAVLTAARAKSLRGKSVRSTISTGARCEAWGFQEYLMVEPRVEWFCSHRHYLANATFSRDGEPRH